MRFIAAFVCSVLMASGISAATPAEEVREAETGFAAAFAARDRAKFASFIADDATFIVRGNGVTGRDNVVKGWDNLISPALPPFSWKQEQVYVDAAGKSAMSIGGVFDPSGTRLATFTSYWQKKNGAWKVVFDGPGAPVCPEEKK